jgi:hypothetical protein
MLIPVKLLCVDRFSGETYEAKGELSIHKDDKGIHVQMTKGGETGFENFSVHPSHRLQIHDWCACMGRCNEYNKVTVPKEEMERAYLKAGVITDGAIKS